MLPPSSDAALLGRLFESFICRGTVDRCHERTADVTDMRKRERERTGGRTSFSSQSPCHRVGLGGGIPPPLLWLEALLNPEDERVRDNAADAPVVTARLLDARIASADRAQQWRALRGGRQRPVAAAPDEIRFFRPAHPRTKSDGLQSSASFDCLHSSVSTADTIRADASPAATDWHGSDTGLEADVFSADDTATAALALVPDESLVFAAVADRVPEAYRPLFGAEVPPVPLAAYAARLIANMRCGLECFVMALVLLRRLPAAVPVCWLSVHRLLLTAAVLCAKSRDDRFYPMAFYAAVGGVTVGEICAMEIALLELLDFNASVSTAEYVEATFSLRRHCANVLFQLQESWAAAAWGLCAPLLPMPTPQAMEAELTALWTAGTVQWTVQ